MRVFITGAAGWIGTVVTQELIKHGHQVIGLARTDAQVDALRKAGAEPLQGDLEDLEALKKGAQGVDGVLHLAYVLDMTDFHRGARIDKAAIQVLADTINDPKKPLIIVGGTLMAPPGALATENTDAERNGALTSRAESADLLNQLTKEGKVRGSSVRLSPTVHGDGDKGFVPMLISSARKNGRAIYVGDGSARWPALHRQDAAVLFRLVLEKGKGGATYHGVAEQGIPMKEIATLMGTELGLPVESKSLDEAGKLLGFFGMVISRDNPSSSEQTQEELGWKPTQIGLLEDMKRHYFAPTAGSKFS